MAYISVNIKFLNKLIGKTKEEAIKLCNKNKHDYRIVHEDGESYIITCDFKVDRVNFKIVENLIIECYIG